MRLAAAGLDKSASAYATSCNYNRHIYLIYTLPYQNQYYII